MQLTELEIRKAKPKEKDYSISDGVDYTSPLPLLAASCGA